MSEEQKKDTPTGFDRFGFHESLVRGITAAGFESPRPIQADTMPAVHEGRDVLGLAQTGTGKTAAFSLPVLDRLVRKPGKGPRVLVLAPTRELANQIATEMKMLSRYTSVRVTTVYGGVSIRNQIDQLRKRPEIVVGCPGRVLDLLGQGHLRFEAVETLILDEADHMFDMGFLPDIRRILGALPPSRQNLLFSATMPKEVRRLADGLLRDPRVVELADAEPSSTIDHALCEVAEDRKRALLDHILADRECESAIVFIRTKHRAKRLAKQLSAAGHRAVSLQGNMSQSQRGKAMRGFRSKQFDILVATDIAARGIDVKDISHVINYDVPNTPEAYTHRIGRTGRAEKEGIALTFVTGQDRGWIKATERMIGRAIPRRQVTGFNDGAQRTTPSSGNGRPRPERGGRRQGRSSRSGRRAG